MLQVYLFLWLEYCSNLKKWKRIFIRSGTLVATKGERASFYIINVLDVRRIEENLIVGIANYATEDVVCFALVFLTLSSLGDLSGLACPPILCFICFHLHNFWSIACHASSDIIAQTFKELPLFCFKILAVYMLKCCHLVKTISK